ncbi:MAG: cellulase family glycosylhydrolase, partial [Planctomycetota bacterium]
WGYSDAILAWELWNEVQYTDAWKNGRQSDVVNWHQDMSDYLRSIDPFGHLITTSDDTSGFEAIWNLPNIDLAQVHYYGLGTAGFIKQAVSLLTRHEKPVIMGEFGRFDEENIAEVALVLHNGIWSAFHLKSGGHFWWWDYIHSNNLYDEFVALSVYAEGENLAAHNLSAADIDVPGAGLYANAVPGLKGFWDVSAQTDFTVQSEGMIEGIEDLSQWLHGSSKSDFCSDPSFAVEFDSSGILKIHVDEVSGWGRNSIRVLLNGQQVFSESYPEGLTDFVIEVPLPRGQQVVKIENTGQDWFCISSYEFQETADTNICHLQFIGLSGDNRAYVWIHDIGSQRGRADHGVFTDVNCILNGLADGDYIVDFYQTRGDGGVFQSNHARSENGGLVIAISEFTKDIAFKVKPVRTSKLE